MMYYAGRADGETLRKGGMIMSNAAKTQQNTGIHDSTQNLSVMEPLKRDPYGAKYWEVDTEKDLFKGIQNTKDLKKAAYDWILNGKKGEQVKSIIDGEELLFTRISASEYVYGRQSKKLESNDYKRKMRMAPSITDLISNASVDWISADAKDHKIAREGFKNYRGRVGIDGKMFSYIVRIGKSSKGNIFYDINLEADVKVPGNKSVSHDNKSSASVNTIASGEEKNKEKLSDRTKQYEIEGQLSLNFDNQTEDQRTLSAEALSDTMRFRSEYVELEGAAITLAEELTENQKIELYGREVKGKAELAAIAQVYRNPRYETLRYFFVDSNRRIV